MAMYQAKCIGCGHQFFVLEVDCKPVERIVCPLCKCGVEIWDIKKPVARNWGKCHKTGKKCNGCKN